MDRRDDSGKLSSFLSQYRVSKGHEFTHTTMGKPGNSYYIPSSMNDLFYELYQNAVNAGETYHITEKHRHIGPIVIDLDFRFSPDAKELDCTNTPKRRFTDAMIKRVCEFYCESARSMLDVEASCVEVYVLEKPDECRKIEKGVLKDGVHIIIPGLVTQPAVQQIIRRKVLSRIADVFEDCKPVNRIDNIVDEAVIEKNNWMMYGSCKPNSLPYKVTNIYIYNVSDRTLSPKDRNDGKEEDFIRMLSIRNKYDETPTNIDSMQEVHDFIEKEEDAKRRRAAIQQVTSTTPITLLNISEEVELVRKLVGILNPSRIEDYNDWVRLGWCLRNIDHRLLETWIDISRKSPKYIEGECGRLWHTMRTGGLGIGTLHMWAREDSPEQYRQILRTDLVSLVKASTTSAHYDVARVVHHLYKHEFVCSNIRQRTWWQFTDHKWKECDSAYSLRKRLSMDVFKEYVQVKQLVTQKAMQSEDDEEQKELLHMSKKLGDLSLKLKVTSFKDNVLRECTELFYQEKFENLLDSNPNLLGFENGVYDLETFEFRAGRPEDYISFSTGINYIPFVQDHPIIKDILNFWSTVHPNPKMRDYVLTTLSSCLSGNIREEHFHIWTGSGSNGKSLSVLLMEKSLGQYCCKFPVTLLTQKRAASNVATPEIARAKGRRFAVLQEPSEDEKLNVGQLKELSGGDTVQTRELFKSPTEWKPQFKLFLLCNQLPNVPSDDGGTWRRIRVAEFASKFTDNPNPDRPNEFPIDITLGSRINTWKEHFVCILIEYYRKYVRSPISEPDMVKAATHEYQRTNDHMADFVYNCIEKTDDINTSMSLNDAFAELREWVKQDQIPLKVPKKQLVQKYLDRVLGKGVQQGRSCVVYRGVSLRDRLG
jgi:P4 family phage/plasmid primase-like protien